MLPSSRTWVRDPFGLSAAPGPPVPVVTVVVHPAGDPGASWPEATGRAETQESAASVDAGGRDGTGDLVGIRPYVTGDRLSLVHWPARARYGSWFVRQLAPEDGVAWRLVVDDRAGVHRRADFERMVSRAQGLVDAAYGEGRPIELSTLSGRSMTVGCAARSLEEARVMLAEVQPRRGASDATVGRGVVVTTPTGARTLSERTARIVVAT